MSPCADGLDRALAPCPDTRIVCFSSLDPVHFLEAWEYEGSRKDALDRVSAEEPWLGGVVEPPDASKRGTALYATFEETSGVDKAIFWFPCAPSFEPPPPPPPPPPSTGADTRSPGANPTPNPRRENEKIIHFRSERPAEPVWDGNANKKRLQQVKESLKLETSPDPDTLTLTLTNPNPNPNPVLTPNP